MTRRAPHVGDVVIFWAFEGTHLLEQAAIVTALSTDEPEHRVRLHVFYETGHAGEGRIWAQHSPIPHEGRWTFRQPTATAAPVSKP